MKLRCLAILIVTVVFLSCSKVEDRRKTSTITYRVYGTGSVDFITYAVDCYPEGQLGCAVDEGYEKSNIDRLEITINGESRLLKKEDFWWIEWNGLMLLEHSVSN